MTTAELVPVYRGRLEAVPRGAAAEAYWNVLAVLAGERVTDIDPERDTDSLLFEAAARRRPTEEYGYQVAITREVLPEEGGSVYLTCSFAYPPVEAGATAQIWGTPWPAAESWLRDVRASPAFALLATPPTATVIDAPSTRT
jgi:hypothetical protein